MTPNATRREMICRTCKRGCKVDFENGKCPSSRWPSTLAETATADASVFKVFLRNDVVSKTVWGPMMWRELHDAAKANMITAEWLHSFTSRVPCGECKDHWMRLIWQLPVRLDDQLAWSIEAHNAVNQRLGKPEWVDTGA